MKTTSFATRTFTPAIRPGLPRYLSKRLFDLALAGATLLLALPVLAGIALAIRLSDGAPVFYVSERMCGRNRGFPLFKFRTMRPAGTEPRACSGAEAHRVTRLGRCLRATRLDELPQLLNVLRGEMSLVGPRPPLRGQVDRDPELYGCILSQKPGVTGLATLALYHAETGRLGSFTCTRRAVEYQRTVLLPRKATLDMVYRRRRSLALDASILACSVLKVLRRGARVRPPRQARRNRDASRSAIF